MRVGAKGKGACVFHYIKESREVFFFLNQRDQLGNGSMFHISDVKTH